MKFQADIDTTDQLSIDKELGVSGPVRELFETLSHFLVSEDIEMPILIVRILSQEGNNALAEPTLWCARCSLHKKHDLLLVDQAANARI
jgi:hypothetical protein